jgi:Zn-dependent protease with chaperone function
MLTRLQDSSAILALLAVMPGAIVWWSGRQLAPRLDDPVLPERLAVSRRQHGIVFVVTLALLGTFAPWSLPWTVPLAVAAITAGGYPLRRVLYQETWSLATCLWFVGRISVGLFAFWGLLAALPLLAQRAGSADWLVGAGLGSVLLLWNARHADILRFLVRARPLEDGNGAARFRELATRCTVGLPRFEVVPLGGGVIANAFALPSLQVPSVLFTETLLERLEDDEAAAICAHELAHLEHYNHRLLRRLNAVTVALIVMGASIAPVSRSLNLDISSWLAPVWLGLFAIAPALRARDRQRQESVCDARAVTLIGDPDPLVRALTKLYLIARVPRRVDSRAERYDTHPSLARRIRDIRGAAGAAPPVLTTAARFQSEDGHTTVIFGEASLEWLDGESVTHVVSYTRLTELRLDARGGRPPRLVVRAGAAVPWEMPLLPKDVTAVQGVLDEVDGHLGAASPPRTIPFAFGRVVIAFLTALALSLGHLAVAFVGLLAFIRPAAAFLGAAGIAALIAAVVVFRDHGSPAGLLLAAPSAVTSTILIGMAWTRRRSPAGRDWPLVAALALTGVIATAALTLGGIGVVRLHQATRSSASPPVLLAALAATLVFRGTRRSRIAAAGVMLAALSTAAAGSQAFLDRFGRDPFLLATPRLIDAELAGAAAREFDVPDATTGIRLSPDGRVVAAALEPDDPAIPSTFHVGRAGRAPVAVQAEDLVFVDSDRIVLVDAGESGTTLRMVSLAAPEERQWSVHAADLVAPSLSIDIAAMRWRVMGWTAARGLVRAEGTIGMVAIERTVWPAPQTRDAYVEAVAAAGDRALVVESRISRSPLQGMVSSTMWMPLLYRIESRYWSLDRDSRRELGSSALQAECSATPVPGTALACSAFDGSRTRFFRIDPATGQTTPVGYFEGRFVGFDSQGEEWLSGWANGTPAAISLATREIVRLPASTGAVTQLIASGDRLAALMYAEGRTRVRVIE